MVFVGLVGGACYVNTYYLMLNEEKVEKEDKELCVNLMVMNTTIGIALSAVVTLLLDATVWKDV